MNDQFVRQVDSTMGGYFKEDLSKYAHGRTTLVTSTAIAIVLLLIIQISFSIELNNPLGLISVFALWLTFNICNRSVRFFVVSVFKMKRKISDTYNTIFNRTGIALEYSNEKNDSLGKQYTDKLKVFSAFNKKMHYNYYNTITGSIDKTEIELYNFKIRYENNDKTKVTAFDGSLYVTPLRVDSDFQLSIIPNRFIRKSNYNLTINGFDVTSIVKGKPQGETHSIQTNNQELTERIMSEDIEYLLNPPFKMGGAGSLIERLEDGVEAMDKNLLLHRIEFMFIKEGRLYVYFPFRKEVSKEIDEHISQGKIYFDHPFKKNRIIEREHLFDSLFKGDANPKYIWDDIQDILGKVRILNKIKGNI